LLLRSGLVPMVSLMPIDAKFKRASGELPKSFVDIDG